MVGRVRKSKLFIPWRIYAVSAGLEVAANLVLASAEEKQATDTILKALAEELAGGGIILENSTMYCKEHLATAGIMTKQKPGASIEADIEFGMGNDEENLSNSI